MAAKISCTDSVMCQSYRLLLLAADLGGILPHTDLLILHPGIPARRDAANP